MKKMMNAVLAETIAQMGLQTMRGIMDSDMPASARVVLLSGAMADTLVEMMPFMKELSTEPEAARQMVEQTLSPEEILEVAAEKPCDNPDCELHGKDSYASRAKSKTAVH